MGYYNLMQHFLRRLVLDLAIGDKIGPAPYLEGTKMEFFLRGSNQDQCS